MCWWGRRLCLQLKSIKSAPHHPHSREQGKLALSLKCSPGGGTGGGGAAVRRQVVESRDVAVHRQVVVALGVFVGSVAEGALTLCE